ncbi:MAG: HEAT repeat domain-containing protein, partial [Peptostreptococcaceae bacterium]
MIELIFNIILVFLYYLICICIYILYNNRKNKKLMKNSIPIKLEIKDKVKAEIENFENDKLYNVENINYIKETINSKKYDKEIIKILLKFKNRETIIEFCNSINLLEPVLSKKDKDEYDKSYKIYVIGEFRNENYYDYLVNSCDDKSSFVQINALKALAKLGDENYFMNGLLNIMSSSSLIHDKVISDN